MAAYVKEQNQKKLTERYLRYLQDTALLDFEPPVATRGPEVIEVDGPEEAQALEEIDSY